MPAPRNIEIFYFDAGGGHSSAMKALSEVIATQRPEWTITPVDLQKLLESVDPIHRLTQRTAPHLQKVFRPTPPKASFKAIQAQDIYNAALKKGWTRGSSLILKALQSRIRNDAPRMEKLLREHWLAQGDTKPDLVISVIPNFNGVIFRALRQICPDTPYVTIMTDMVDCPPHFWMEDQDQSIICGTAAACDQARATGFYDAENIFGVSGMILKQAFYKPALPSALTRRDLGLSDDLPTALIMFGGNGSFISRKIVDQLESAAPDIQTIVMCGKNQPLFDSLQDRPHCHAVAFTADVPAYMRLADFMIGKPGPGSLSEAIHMGCPVIIEHNAATMPQERPNVDWVVENGVGIVVKNFNKDIAGAVRALTGDLERYKRNIQTNIPDNRAVYEIVGCLDHIIKAGTQSPPERVYQEYS